MAWHQPERAAYASFWTEVLRNPVGSRRAGARVFARAGERGAWNCGCSSRLRTRRSRRLRGAFMSNTTTRIEHDLLGDKAVPIDAYYGVQTARGLDNFHISGVRLSLYPNLIKALAMVK